MVIRTAAERSLATVEHITDTKQGDYGPYRSVLFKRSDLQGDEAKVWRAMDPEQAAQFNRGQQVYLIPTTNKKGKPSWDIELLDAPAAPAASPTEAQPVVDPAPLSPQQKQASAIEAELLELKRKPYWRDRWFDSTQGRRAGQYYTRLCWFISPGKKRRQTPKSNAEIVDHRDRIERGNRIKVLERELEHV